MSRMTRYQGAIIREGHILLLKQVEHASGRSYWLLPGGRTEPNETEQECVQREVHEETGLHVEIMGMILDETEIVGRSYDRRKTYLCHVLDGEARPGYEPELEHTGYTFTDVGWFDLQHPATWNDEIVGNANTRSLLLDIRGALGYMSRD